MMVMVIMAELTIEQTIECGSLDSDDWSAARPGSARLDLDQSLRVVCVCVFWLQNNGCCALIASINDQRDIYQFLAIFLWFCG